MSNADKGQWATYNQTYCIQEMMIILLPGEFAGPSCRLPKFSLPWSPLSRAKCLKVEEHTLYYLSPSKVRSHQIQKSHPGCMREDDNSRKFWTKIRKKKWTKRKQDSLPVIVSTAERYSLSTDAHFSTAKRMYSSRSASNFGASCKFTQVLTICTKTLIHRIKCEHEWSTM